MAGPVKGRAEPEAGYRCKAQCAMRAGGNGLEGRGTGVTVVRVPGWGRKAQRAPWYRKEGLLRWGRKSHQQLGLGEVREQQVQRYR